MATKTIYTCDNCGNEVDKKDLCSIEVNLRYDYKPNCGYNNNVRTVRKDICVDCLESMGLKVKVPQVLRTNELTQNQKTLEEKCIEILQEFGVKFEE